MRVGVNRMRGDTIIEVLLAITVFSLVAVGAMTIMNQGTNSAQRSLEVTLVKQQIDAQAEALRAAHQAYIADPKDGAIEATWNEIIDPAHVGNIPVADTCPSDFSNAFIMNSRTATVSTASITRIDDVNAPPYAQVKYLAGSPATLTGVYGIWIESTKLTSTDFQDAYDFRVRACWYGPGLDVPMTLDTAVRLYEPQV